MQRRFIRKDQTEAGDIPPLFTGRSQYRRLVQAGVGKEVIAEALRALAESPHPIQLESEEGLSDRDCDVILDAILKQLGDRALPDFGEVLRQRGEHGVLVYGTEDARETYRTEVPDLPEGFARKGPGQPVGVATEGFFTADRYSNFAWRDFEFDGRAEFSIFQPAYVAMLQQSHGSDRAGIAERIRRDLVAWTTSKVSEPDLSQVLDFQRQLLDHPSWSPLVTFFESGAHSGKKEGLPAGTAEEVAKAKFQSQTRRASKFGLVYMKRSGGSIAFIREVGTSFGTLPADSSFSVNKGTSANRPGGGIGRARVPITVSEERASHKEKKDFGGLLHFGGGQRVPAPWKADPDNWGMHAVARLQKYRLLARLLGIPDTAADLATLKANVTRALREKHPTLSTSEARARELRPRAKL